MLAVKTLKVRIKDKHVPVLREWSRSVNFVWNYINELSSRAIRERGMFLSAYDIQKYTDGAGKELGLHSHTVQCVGKEYATRRKQFKKAKLRWRRSSGAKRSLGWVPINTGAASWKHGQVYHNGHYFQVWDSYGLAGYKFRSASFNEDSRGRWYFNIVVEVECPASDGTAAVGIDLGLKAAATASTGQIANQRKDLLHKFSSTLVAENAAIFVGDVTSEKLVKTKMAKSTLDAGWSMLKTMLDYKCHQAGVIFMEVNEAYTTQACSCCGAISACSPKGRAGLRIREWTCSECGAEHDRDVNAARNILARGLARLAEGTPTEAEGHSATARIPATQANATPGIALEAKACLPSGRGVVKYSSMKWCRSSANASPAGVFMPSGLPT